MSLVTTCPHCGTMFRFQPTELTSHGGEGRCSVCHQVFNALENITHINENTSTNTLETNTAELPIEQPSADISTNETNTPEFAPPSTNSETEETPVASTADPAPELPETLFQRKRFTWSSFLKPMSVAIVLLLLATLQTTLFFRNQISHRFPSTYPPLANLCKAFSCTVALPQQAKLIAIEDYSLRSHPDYNDVLVLESTLHNRAKFPLAFPVLNLTLTDNFNAPVANRIFKPEDYLPKETDLSQGLKGKASISIALHLGVVGIKSSKYKLFAQDPAPTPATSSDTSS